MTLFEIVDLLVDFVFGVLHWLADSVSRLVRLVVSGVLMELLHLIGSVLGIAPSLFCRTSRLVDDSLIRELFFSNRFPSALLYFSYSLINLARNLILVHGVFPLYLEVQLLCLQYL